MSLTLLFSSFQSHTCTLYGASIVLIGGDNAAADVHFLDVGMSLSSSLLIIPTLHKSKNNNKINTDKLAWGTPRVTGARAAPTSMHGHDCCRIGNRFVLFYFIFLFCFVLFCFFFFFVFLFCFVLFCFFAFLLFCFFAFLFFCFILFTERGIQLIYLQILHLWWLCK